MNDGPVSHVRKKKQMNAAIESDLSDRRIEGERKWHLNEGCEAKEQAQQIDTLKNC